jgi:DNA-binding PadR family transcriptional regulator
MSVRQGLLALLAERPMYGYQLRAEFERRTGGTWPLNIGQVYTTLSRLQRDGMVAESDRHPDGSVVYALTEAGSAQAELWWTTAVDRSAPTRDELVIKLALAVTAPEVDVAGVVRRQRTETLRSLQQYTRLKRSGGRPQQEQADASGVGAATDAASDAAWLLVLENLIFVAEAEVRWLDHVEATLAAGAGPFRAAPPEPDPDPDPHAEANPDQQEVAR